MQDVVYVGRNWKTRFPHCMFPMTNSVEGFSELSYPNICPLQPAGKNAFCKEHRKLAEELNYPTTYHQRVCIINF